MDKRFFEQCEREALHLSGAIQPHGSLLVADPAGIVRHVSANIVGCLGNEPADWLNRPLPAELARLIVELGDAPGSRILHEGMADGLSGPLDVVTTRGANGEVVLELTARSEGGGEKHRPRTAFLPNVPGDEAGLVVERQLLVERIAARTGFQRVMYYRFREDGDGEVVAEARQGDAYGSYLGLRFPASDIPQIARALYMKNPWRLIPDVAAESVPVLGAAGATPPDLTFSDLRSVSPVHLVYLANMGVAASLSFPVVMNGGLIALVAAHHCEPQYLPAARLEYAAADVRAHAFALTAFQSQQRIRLIDGMAYRFAPLRAVLHQQTDLFAGWPALSELVLREFQADGAVLCRDDDCVVAGTAFEPAALEAFDSWFCDRQGEFVWSTDSLMRHPGGFPLSEIAGVLAIRIGGGRSRQRGSGLRLYLTRVEHVHEVAWGGNPDKPVEFHDGQLGIAPRRSFEKWVEKRLGYCRPWDNESRLLALKLREELYREASL